MNSKNTKRALLGSVVAMLVCFTMLLSTTFAWFTDTAVSASNKIVAGTLKVDLEVLKDGSFVSIKESKAPIFNYEKWEPGYTEVKVLKVENEGSLALKWYATFSSEKALSELANVIDVFVCPSATEIGVPAGRDLTGYTKVGTLAEFLNTIETTTYGVLYADGTAGDEAYLGIALQMQETAGNEYQGKDLGGKFDITILATQLNYESDSFNENYDEDAFVADYYVTTADGLIEALETSGNGEVVGLMGDVKIDPANMSNAYGTTGINIKNGQILDGNGNTLDVKGAGGTWDSGINITGGTVRNITVTGSFRGIFINHNGTVNGPVVLENVTTDGTVYTISCDQGTNNGLTATGCTFNGWTSFAKTLGNAEFINCKFAEGSGYAFCRPYAPTTFVGCDFAAGYKLDARAAVTFENCTIGGVALTADNLSTLVTSNIANASVK